MDLRGLINHTVSDIFVHMRRAPRSALRSIAHKIVDRQPASFADYINGKRVENGVNSITMMLESETENLNRRKQASEQEPSTGKHKVARKSSLDEEALSQLEATRVRLCNQYQLDPSVLSLNIEHDMVASYAYQRYHVDTEPTAIAVFEKWPFLRFTNFVLLHCKCFTGIDVLEQLQSTVPSQIDEIYAFMSSIRSPLKAPILRAMNDADKVHWPKHFLPLMMAHFREDISCLLQFFSVCFSHIYICNFF